MPMHWSPYEGHPQAVGTTDFLPAAPHDGRRIRFWHKWTKPEGCVVRWCMGNVGFGPMKGWFTDNDALASFDERDVIKWRPEPS